MALQTAFDKCTFDLQVCIQVLDPLMLLRQKVICYCRNHLCQHAAEVDFGECLCFHLHNFHFVHYSILCRHCRMLDPVGGTTLFGMTEVKSSHFQPFSSRVFLVLFQLD